MLSFTFWVLGEGQDPNQSESSDTEFMSSYRVRVHIELQGEVSGLGFSFGAGTVLV